MIAMTRMRNGNAIRMSTRRMTTTSSFPTEEPRYDAEERAEEEREQHADEADLQVQAYRVDDARPLVAAEVVRAQRMARAARRQQRSVEILRDGIVGRQQRGREAGDDDDQHA